MPEPACRNRLLREPMAPTGFRWFLPATTLSLLRRPVFTQVKASGIVVEASQTVPFSMKLELAKGQEIIEVTAQTPLVQTATSDLALQIDRTTIQNAPLVDRDVFSTLPFLAPQVSPGLNLNPASGGARESGTAYLLNGADDNDNFSEGAVNIHPPLESVEDFSILTNSMGAQYGRGCGRRGECKPKVGYEQVSWRTLRIQSQRFTQRQRLFL